MPLLDGLGLNGCFVTPGTQVGTVFELLSLPVMQRYKPRSTEVPEKSPFL